MLKVGLTGGIGTGKSTVADMFRDLGVPIIDTDLIAREVVAPGTEGLAAVRERFGDSVLRPDGGLDRGALRRRVFADESERRDLEAILHPRIIARMVAETEALRAPYCLLVIPLLVETGLGHLVDRVLVVDAPLEAQRRRAARRDGVQREEIERIIASQAERSARLAAADDVIRNDGDLASVRDQVHSLHRRYLALARGGEPGAE